MSIAPAPLVLATLNFPPTAGGIEQLCAELAREFTALGVPLHVLAPSAPGQEAFDAAAPYRVTRLPNGPLRHWHLAREVLRLGRAGQERILFGQWTGAGLVVAHREAFGQPPTLVALAHGKEMLRADEGLRSSASYARYRAAILSRLSAVLAVSEFTAGKARLAGARNVCRLSPGVDAARFARLAEGRAPLGTSRPGPTILTLSRLVRRKGVDTLISALPELLRQHPELRCLVAGDGPDRPRLERLAGDLALQEHVVFLGRVAVDRLPDLYASADLFALLSREDLASGDAEGFGLVLLEAQAAGTPVIAAQSGGMADALVPGETGLLVPADQPATFAEVVGRLLGDPLRLQQMRQAAVRHASTQSWRKTAEQALQAIDRAASSPVAGGLSPGRS